MADTTIRLTVAQAIVRYLMNQYHRDRRHPHAYLRRWLRHLSAMATCPVWARRCSRCRTEMPLYRGQNEQSMGFAAAAYAKYHLRRRFMFCTASAGPGTANLLTASALAHANRLPMLMLCGDTFLTRLPDPVLQQLEHFGNPALGLNDAFKAVTRYWDRITHPAQIIQTLPAALATMLDPADCGPAFIGLPQDLQGWSYDYPESFFAPRTHRIRRQAPDAEEVVASRRDAARRQTPDDHSRRRGAVFRRGGGVDRVRRRHAIPVVETIAGRANMVATHGLNIGPIGVTGSDSANAIAEEADVILAVGTRLQDFTTGSWTAFAKGRADHRPERRAS
jgi:3D-(3,5/4)-trihydroxycyclohexane-1,2-dione acylhydrolase (decyclizing)